MNIDRLLPIPLAAMAAIGIHLGIFAGDPICEDTNPAIVRVVTLLNICR